MPHPRKLFCPNTVVMVTFRTEEGLPFVPVKFINQLIWSALARGYELYEVEVCAITVEQNHIHMILRVTNPEAVSAFIGYLKQETAHGINRLLGRRRRTVWAEGFDSPTILDKHTTLQKFAYVLLNPVKDKLVSSMDEYPGVSSYSMMMDRKYSVKVERIFRDAISPVRNPEKPWLEESSYQFDDERKSESVFRLFPYIWKNCFADTKDLSDEEIREQMLEFIELERSKLEIPILNPMRLKKQSLLATYVPKKHGKRMICLSIFKEYRRKFVGLYRSLCDQAILALSHWKAGNRVPFPLGLFPPCMPRAGNFITSAVWI